VINNGVDSSATLGWGAGRVDVSDHLSHQINLEPRTADSAGDGTQLGGDVMKLPTGSAGGLTETG
jgi:hypothetical protein